MSRKEIQRAYADVVSADLSNAAGFTSSAITVNQVDGLFAVVEWSGGTGVTGTLVVQARVGEPLVDSNDKISSWVSLDFGSPITISGASGSHVIEIITTKFTQYRFVYTYTAGSAGSLDIRHTAKTVGA